MTQVMKGSYSLNIDPSMKWFNRPQLKCSSEYYERKVLLLVNWFKFKDNIYEREYYEYDVQMHKVKEYLNKRSGRMEKKRTVIAIPDRPALFWEHLRQQQQETRFHIEDYVFDGKDTVYSVNKHHEIETTMKDPKNPKINYLLIISFRNKFRLNFSREDPLKAEEANRSYKFLKDVITQKVRYEPRRDKEKVEIEFTKNFVYDQSSILRVPESFYDSKFDYSLEIAPRIEAWFGIYIGVKELFDGEPALNFAIVDKLFYNAPKMSLLDYILLVVDPNTHLDENRKERKITLRNSNLSINEKMKSRVRQLLEGLKLKSEEIWDHTASRMVERHVNFLDLCDFNAHEHHVTVQIGRGRDACKKKVPLYRIYEENKKFIEFPFLQLIKVKSGATEYVVPMERLYVHEKPQRYKNRIDFVMQEKFLKKATRKPHHYKEETIEMLKDLDFSSNNLNFVKNFGLCSDLEMITCPGKVLREPMLVNKDSIKIKMTPVVRGFQEKQLNVVPEKELCCALFVLRDEEEKNTSLEEAELYEFYKALIDGCEFRGMRIGQHENVQAKSILYNPENHKYGFYNNVTLLHGTYNFKAAARDAKTMFESLPDKNDKILLFIIISERLLNAYGYVKYYCDIEIGVASQHITVNTVKKALKSLAYEGNKGSKRIFFQIALKINAKLGGVNQELDWSESGEISPEEKERRKKMPLTMYVGIDVTHPTSGSGLDFSIAALVASVNPGGTRYRNVIVTQQECRPGERPVAHGRERTDILEGKFIKLLEEFADKNNNRMPSHIVVYRDGVSDSEMLRVSHDELRSLKSEVKTFKDKRGGQDDEPNYTFIVIQKKHKTRILRKIDDIQPTDIDAAKEWDEDMKTSNDTGILNPSSGTTVDKKIVSKYKFDFYLASHHGALGTSRPGYYTVMYDDKNMSQDEIYKMSYELAFLSARCRKPISLPAPVHYAHLSCEKAKELYRTYKEHYSGELPRPPTRQEMEKFLQTSANYPGMSFA